MYCGGIKGEEREKEKNWDGTGARKKVPSLWEPPSLARQSAGTEKVLQRLREESSRGLQKAGRAGPGHLTRPQPETRICRCAWGRTDSGEDCPVSPEGLECGLGRNCKCALDEAWSATEAPQ